MELEGYSRPTCSKQPRLVDCRIDGCRQQARSSTSFVDNAIDFPWRYFGKFGVWYKVPEGSTPIFGDAQISVWQTWKEASMPKPARFVQSFRYNTGLWRTGGRADRQTDRRTLDDSIFRASIASCGHKTTSCNVTDICAQHYQFSRWFITELCVRVNHVTSSFDKQAAYWHTRK